MCKRNQQFCVCMFAMTSTLKFMNPQSKLHIRTDRVFRGEIDEEDLKDDTCAKEVDSRGKDSKGGVNGVVLKKDNKENYGRRRPWRWW